MECSLAVEEPCLLIGDWGDHVKKKTVLLIGLITVVFFICFIGSGFMKNAFVTVEKYTVNADGTEITIHTSVASSMGYVRKVSIHEQQGGKMYLDFYSAFGGMNGRIGAKNVYILPLKVETESIGIYRNSDCYEQVLVKDADGIWKRTGQSETSN